MIALIIVQRAFILIEYISQYPNIFIIRFLFFSQFLSALSSNSSSAVEDTRGVAGEVDVLQARPL